MLEVAGRLGLGSFDLAAHDIGGGVAQHLAVHSSDRVRRMVLINAVMFDSWPVPAVARFEDPQLRAGTSAEESLEARRRSRAQAVQRSRTPAEVEDYVSPWREERRARSWMAMAAAAVARFTSDLMPGSPGQGSRPGWSGA